MGTKSGRDGRHDAGVKGIEGPLSIDTALGEVRLPWHVICFIPTLVKDERSERSDNEKIPDEKNNRGSAPTRTIRKSLGVRRSMSIWPRPFRRYVE